MIRIPQLSRRRRTVFIAASVLIHGAILAIVFAPSERTEELREVAVSLKDLPAATDATATSEQSAAEQQSQPAAADLGGPGGAEPSPAPLRRSADVLHASLVNELRDLRSSLVVRTAHAAETSPADGLGVDPAEPTCHLSDGEANEVIARGRGGDRGAGGRRGIIAVGGGCP